MPEAAASSENTPSPSSPMISPVHCLSRASSVNPVYSRWKVVRKSGQQGQPLFTTVPEGPADATERDQRACLF